MFLTQAYPNPLSLHPHSLSLLPPPLFMCAEELDGDDGEMVVGFCVKKAPKSTEEGSSGEFLHGLLLPDHRQSFLKIIYTFFCVQAPKALKASR